MDNNLENSMTQRDIEDYLKQSLCFTDSSIEECQKLGLTRSLLSLSNLDRIKNSISSNQHFNAIPVIDGDQLMWLAKYVRFEKKLPPSEIDELMDLRDSWKSVGDVELEKQIQPLKDEIKILKANFELELEKQKQININLNNEITAKTKEAMIENGVQSGTIFTFQERLKETESNNAELRKILRKYSKNDNLNKSPLAKLEPI